MNLDELIAALQALREEHGGELPVIYVGWNSPVHGVAYYAGSPRNDAAACLTN